MADKDSDVRRSASDVLQEIVQVAPELRKEALRLLRILTADKDDNVRISARVALKEIEKSPH